MNHKKLFALAVMLIVMLAAALPAFATNGAEVPEAAESAAVEVDNSISGKAVAAGIAIGLASFGGALGMGIASSKASEGIARQPEADGKIRSAFMLSLVFIETAIIYSLLVVILIIFVL